MEKLFSVSQTAKKVNMTAETLRHYDRIGLVKPFKTDEWTGYRYYSEREIVQLNTVHALQCMDLSLSEIKTVLQYEDFEKITHLLKEAEINADKKIAELNYAKSKIGAARLFYENKLKGTAENRDIFVNTYPKRVILLSDKLHTPAVSDLWDYHRHFYKQIGEENKTRFSFEDLAGIYKSGGRENLFALCITYEDTEGIKVLPAGRYLCAGCTEENCGETEARLMRIAASDYMQSPEFIIRIVVLTGILKWNYQMQVYIGS